MNWLTSEWLFWLGFPLFIIGQVAVALAFHRNPNSGKSFREVMTGKWREVGADDSGLAAIRKHIERLLRQGYDRGALVLTFKGTDAFIQFRKYIHAKGDQGLELGFPDAEWSREFFPRLAEWCEQNGFSHDIAHNSEGGGLNFLHVDTGDDLDAAMRLVEGIVTDIFSLEPNARFSHQFDGVSELGEEIDDPTAAPLSPGVAALRRDKDYFEKTGVHLQDGCLHTLVTLIGVWGFFGLEYSLVWRTAWLAAAVEPTWGDWTMEIFSISLKARTFEVVCLVLVMCGLLFQRSPPSRRIQALQIRNLSEAKRRASRRQRIRVRYVYLPLMLAALTIFWLRG